jgi:hypothetical protein
MTMRIGRGRRKEDVKKKKKESDWWHDKLTNCLKKV